MGNPPSELHLKLEKIQTWLFSIPRLRAMVGANVLLAEVLHEKLPSLVRETGRPWKLAAPEGAFPEALADDPLGRLDRPNEDATNSITSRHGGHFSVALEHGAKELAAAISQLLHDELPGLRFSFEGISNEIRPGVFTSSELPVLEPCKWSGAGLASARAKTGKDEEHASLESCRRQEAARRAEDEEHLSPASALNHLLGGKVAETFEQLADERYLAVIHADGNGVGGELAPLPPAHQCAYFFHRNRVAMKIALAHALAEISADEAKATGTSISPLLPLMLGGDDLLVACRADQAMRFVVSLCQRLKAWQRESPPPPQHPRPDFQLTLGIGVVFAPYTLPFNRLHEAAEALASSAKRHKDKKLHSVVDWAICTSAWVDKDVLATREAWCCGPPTAPRLLSRRPLTVLHDDAASYSSLQRLVEQAAQLEKAPGVARSQLHYLADQLGRGAALADLAWEELPDDTRRALRQAGISQLWEPLHADPPRRPHAAQLTSMRDLVEIFEIPHLGARR